MTTPPEPTAVPTPEEVALEEWAVAHVTAGLVAALGPIVAALLLATGAGATLLAKIAVRILGAGWPDLGPRLVGVIERAMRLAGGEPDRAEDELLPEPDVELDERLRERLRQAADTVRDGHPGMAAGQVRRVLSIAEGAARAAVYEGFGAAEAQIAAEAGLNLIWVPEPNACLHCLAYAGWVVEPGAAFPPGLTFYRDPAGDAKPIPRSEDLGPLRWPPLHPNCRCRVRVTEEAPGRPTTNIRIPEPSARLAGEARRSVLRGWSAYASNPAALRAARALLASGAALPTSVEARARRDVKRGEFSARHLAGAGRVGSARYS